MKEYKHRLFVKGLDLEDEATLEAFAPTEDLDVALSSVNDITTIEIISTTMFSAEALDTLAKKALALNPEAEVF